MARATIVFLAMPIIVAAAFGVICLVIGALIVGLLDRNSTVETELGKLAYGAGVLHRALRKS